MNKSYSYKDFKIEILYEDKYIAILNKPSGLLTHKKKIILILALTSRQSEKSIYYKGRGKIERKYCSSFR